MELWTRYDTACSGSSSWSQPQAPGTASRVWGGAVGAPCRCCWCLSLCCCCRAGSWAGGFWWWVQLHKPSVPGPAACPAGLGQLSHCGGRTVLWAQQSRPGGWWGHPAGGGSGPRAAPGQVCCHSPATRPAVPGCGPGACLFSLVQCRWSVTETFVKQFQVWPQLPSTGWTEKPDESPGAPYSLQRFQCAGLLGLLREWHKLVSFPQTTSEHPLFSNLLFSEFSFVLETDRPCQSH